MEDITIINFSQGPCSFDSDLFSSTPKEELKLGVIPRLRYSLSSDYVGFQMDITLTSNNIQILKSGFLIGMLVKGWSDMLKSGINLTNERERLISLCRTVWLVATGVIAHTTKISDREDFILPPIDMARFAEEVLLISSNTQKD